MRRSMFVTVLALGLALAVGCDDDEGPTTPAAERFRATLNGANERPDPRTTPGAGTAQFTFRRDTLRWDITMTGMNNVTAAHIHIGDANTAGGILLGLTSGTLTNTKIEGFVTRAQFTAPGSPNQAVTFDNLLDMMRNGNQVYVNVHTRNTTLPATQLQAGNFPAGEIRGQVTREP
jgi:CHRD domain